MIWTIFDAWKKEGVVATAEELEAHFRVVGFEDIEVWQHVVDLGVWRERNGHLESN